MSIPTYTQGTPFISTLRIALLTIWGKWPYRLIQDQNGNLYTAQQLLNNQNPGTKALMHVMVEYAPETGSIVWVTNGVRTATLYNVTNQTRNPAFMVL